MGKSVCAVGKEKMVGSMWAGKGEEKKMLIIVEAVLVCHLFILCCSEE